MFQSNRNMNAGTEGEYSNSNSEIDKSVWLTPRTAVLTLTDSTGFHHACGWTVLEVCGGDKISPAFMYKFIYRNKTNIILTINIPVRTTLNTSSYNPTS